MTQESTTAQDLVPVTAPRSTVIDCKIDELHYGNFRAVRDAHIPVEKKTITAFIGPSGCGKGGQQQRLCIARAIATEPEVLLMDEPCSALDPIATRKIEELMLELKERVAIAIVTHNLQQAARVADKTGFMYVDTSTGGRTGYLVEFGNTVEIFQNPKEKATQQYISGEFS